MDSAKLHLHSYVCTYYALQITVIPILSLEYEYCLDLWNSLLTSVIHMSVQITVNCEISSFHSVAL